MRTYSDFRKLLKQAQAQTAPYLKIPREDADKAPKYKGHPLTSVWMEDRNLCFFYLADDGLEVCVELDLDFRENYYGDVIEEEHFDALYDGIASYYQIPI